MPQSLAFEDQDNGNGLSSSRDSSAEEDSLRLIPTPGNTATNPGNSANPLAERAPAFSSSLPVPVPVPITVTMQGDTSGSTAETPNNDTNDTNDANATDATTNNNNAGTANNATTTGPPPPLPLLLLKRTSIPITEVLNPTTTTSTIATTGGASLPGPSSAAATNPLLAHSSPTPLPDPTTTGSQPVGASGTANTTTATSITTASTTAATTTFNTTTARTVVSCQPSSSSSSSTPFPPGPGAGVDLASDSGFGGDREEDQDEDEDAEAEAAAEQAEDGGIVVDAEEMQLDLDLDLGLESSDAGYESDANSRASTSLASSVRNYVYENGRRYHRFREGRYNFPNDDVEQEREDMKHAMVKMLCQKLYFAPLVPGRLREVLDIGTGTGSWAIEIGDEFPGANVLGIDLHAEQPEWVPPNVRFMVDDAESTWLHPRDFFDYIHCRHTVMAMKNWPKLLRRAFEHMRPGGWIEMQEVNHVPESASSGLSADHPVSQFWSLINEGLTNLGVDFHVSSDGRLAEMMRQSGFVNVTERVFHVPIGTWPKNKVLKTVGLYWRTILLDGAQAIALGPLTRGCGWSPEQVEVFLVQVRKAYYDNASLMYMPFYITYGQKPEV